MFSIRCQQVFTVHCFVGIRSVSWYFWKMWWVFCSSCRIFPFFFFLTTQLFVQLKTNCRNALFRLTNCLCLSNHDFQSQPLLFLFLMFFVSLFTGLSFLTRIKGLLLYNKMKGYLIWLFLSIFSLFQLYDWIPRNPATLFREIVLKEKYRWTGMEFEIVPLSWAVLVRLLMSEQLFLLWFCQTSILVLDFISIFQKHENLTNALNDQLINRIGKTNITHNKVKKDLEEWISNLAWTEKNRKCIK